MQIIVSKQMFWSENLPIGESVCAVNIRYEANIFFNMYCFASTPIFVFVSELVQIFWSQYKVNDVVPRVRWRRPRRGRIYRGAYSACTQLALCLRLALLKGESWLWAETIDDSKTSTPVLHNTSVVVWNLYCVRVIIVRLNKRSKPRCFVHN